MPFRAKVNVDELVIPVQGGTFHLLAAGTPVQDTSRVLQGRNFAMLIAQLRHRYEMIIIDSPPVLPIPDALILGRWTDGALLATRFEVSRSPQVERARRQLDQAGIPVLGTVLNGMRSSDSYYGAMPTTGNDLLGLTRPEPPRPREIEILDGLGKDGCSRASRGMSATHGDGVCADSLPDACSRCQADPG